MPTIRPKILVDQEYVSQTKYTIDLDLPTTGLLSSLFLKVRAKTTATGLCPSPALKYLISSVSVNQAGQAALNAVPPEVFQADYYYKTGKMPRRGYQRPGGDGLIIDEVIPILFGEMVDDPKHYIDLSTLSDPKLSITYDLAETDHVASTIWNTAYYPRFTVLANLFQGPELPASEGYYSLRQIEGYTPANSEKKKIELKGSRPIKRLYVQYDELDPSIELLHLVDRCRLWGANESWIPFDLEITPWLERIRELYGLCNVKGHIAKAKGSQTVDTGVDRRIAWDVKTPNVHSLHALILAGGGRKGTLRFVTISDGNLSTTIQAIEFSYTGLLPWSIAPVDMPGMLGIDHLDPTVNAPVFLELDHAVNAGDYSAPVKVHIEDLVV